MNANKLVSTNFDRIRWYTGTKAKQLELRFYKYGEIQGRDEDLYKKFSGASELFCDCLPPNGKQFIDCLPFGKQF